MLSTAIASPRRTVKRCLYANQNGDGFARTFSRLESPLLHGLNCLLVQSIAHARHDGDVVKETICADDDRKDNGAVDLCFRCFLRAFWVGCGSEGRRLVGAGRRVLVGKLFQGLQILRWCWFLLARLPDDPRVGEPLRHTQSRRFRFDRVYLCDRERAT
jgi:hypothetical protein